MTAYGRPASVACQAAAAETQTKTNTTAAALRTAYPSTCAEQEELVELSVEGTMPKWLKGDLYRTGPGMSEGFNHFFDGYAMPVHFNFADGKVHWNQRFLETESYKGYKQTGKPIQGEFGTPLPVMSSIYRTMVGQLGLGDGVTDNASVTIYPGSAPGEIVALTEAVVGTYRVQGQSLDTVCRVKFDDAVKGQLSTAHPKQLASGAYVNVVHTLPGGKFEVCTSAAPDAGVRQVVRTQQVANEEGLSPWMHDLAVSGTRIAIVENPAYFDLSALVGISKADFLIFKWVPENGTTITVLDIEGSDEPKTFKLPPLFNFHFLNTYTTTVDGLGLCMVLDAAFAKDPSGVPELLISNIRKPGSNLTPMTLKRVILPLESDKPPIVEDLVTDHSTYGEYAELPNINPAMKGKDYQYAYAGTIARPAPLLNQISKIDVKNKKITAQWQPPDGGIPACEPHFVARPGGVSEDDGVVLAPSIDGQGKTLLVVLDAKNLRELGRAYTPKNFCQGFHSTFIPA